MLISQAAFDLIVEQEVTSKAAYEKRYRRPEWPGGGSGVTIGIGYDVGAGVSSRAQLDADWKGKIPDAMIDVLAHGIGVTGEAAHRLLPQIKPLVDVPWEAAIDVFANHDVPKWTVMVAKALPNTDKLSADCLGSLVSLAYNRGASFSQEGDRYTEMRAIKTHMAACEFAKIPDEFRRMKRLWGANLQGLLDRRDAEAALFERGLGASVAAQSAATPAPPSIFWVQQSLNRLGADPLLNTDGVTGEMTRAAIRTFQRSHGLTADGQAGPLTCAAIERALSALH